MEFSNAAVHTNLLEIIENIERPQFLIVSHPFINYYKYMQYTTYKAWNIIYIFTINIYINKITMN